MDCHQYVTSMMGTMTDVDHDAWNMQVLPICGKILDPMKHLEHRLCKLAIIILSPPHVYFPHVNQG